MTLDRLTDGQKAYIEKVNGEGSLRQHLLDMGLIPGATVTLLKRAPLGDPIEVIIHGYALSLRISEAQLVDVSPCENGIDEHLESKDNFAYNVSLHDHNAHPGLGEAGRYHDKTHEERLEEGTRLTFALVGQQNSGKTTLFNYLTGANQRVGNFPGVTVNRIDGEIKGYPNSQLTDLPGIYSFSGFTGEEAICQRFILQERPKAIINVLDAGNIERNLYLTIQLMELDIPMVLALNMMDEVSGSGGSIRVNEMERLLGIPVVPISAAKGDGITELMEHAMHVAVYQEKPARQDFCDAEDHGGAVHRCIHSIMHLIEDHLKNAEMPTRFAVSRLVEGDKEMEEILHIPDNELKLIENMVHDMENHRGMDRYAAMAEMRFSFIEKLCSRTVIKPKESRERERSKSIDKILTGRYTAIPAFFVIMALIFWLTFDLIGSSLQDLLSNGIDSLAVATETLFESLGVNMVVRSLVHAAIFTGVGTVVSFFPIIVILFFFLSMLEDSGYMSRVAFLSDKLLSKLGLSGRSIVPLLIGFGCTVPGAMASRTLPSSKDRKATIMLLPFMSCSAKIAIYGFFTKAFFPDKAGLVMILIYLLGIFVAIMVALLRKFFSKDRTSSPFVMEMPVYRLPNLKNVAHLLWDKTKDFLQMAFTVILLATIVIWALQSFNFRLHFVTDSSDSILAWMAGYLTPIFTPIGLGDWRVVTALISGFMAKENVVATLEVLGAGAYFTSVTAVPMLIFCLLYTPCVAAISAISRELGKGKALFVVAFQIAIAWLVAYIGYLIALL